MNDTETILSYHATRLITRPIIGHFSSSFQYYHYHHYYNLNCGNYYYHYYYYYYYYHHHYCYHHYYYYYHYHHYYHYHDNLYYRITVIRIILTFVWAATKEESVPKISTPAESPPCTVHPITIATDPKILKIT